MGTLYYILKNPMLRALYTKEKLWLDRQASRRIIDELDHIERVMGWKFTVDEERRAFHSFMEKRRTTAIRRAEDRRDHIEDIANIWCVDDKVVAS